MRADEAVGVLGANGAGKTTLMRAISGMIPPNSGQVIFEGPDLNSIPSSAIVGCGFAHVPEGRRLTVWDNLRMGAYTPETLWHFKGSVEYVFEQNVTDALDKVARVYVPDVGRITLEDTAAELRDSPQLQQIYLGL